MEKLRNSYVNIRNLAIIGLLTFSGIRISEPVNFSNEALFVINNKPYERLQGRGIELMSQKLGKQLGKIKYIFISSEEY